MTESTLVSLAWLFCPVSTTVLVNGLIRKYALSVITSVQLATLIWLQIVWLDERGHLDPYLEISGALFVIYALVTSLLFGGAMRLLRVVHVAGTAGRVLRGTCATLGAIFLAAMMWNAARLGRTKLPPSVAGFYFLQVNRDRAPSDAQNCDRDLTVTRTGIDSRRFDDSTWDEVSFRRVERISEVNGECYSYEADRCNGSVCVRDDRHIVLTACSPGERPPCVDPVCTAFAGEARRW
jgi:hypothetical protein